MRLPVERVRRGAPGEPRPDSNARGEAECAVCAPPKKAATIDLACQTLSGYEIVWGQMITSCLALSLARDSTIASSCTLKFTIPLSRSRPASSIR
jgi:hypothetical protein